MTARPETTSKTGNLTETPELGRSKSGTPFTRFRFAVETPLSTGDWDGEKETAYYSGVCFNSTAEHVAASLQKGDRILVIGREEIEEWTGRDGKPRETNKFVADAVGADLRFENVSIDRTRRSGTR